MKLKSLKKYDGKFIQIDTQFDEGLIVSNITKEDVNEYSFKYNMIGLLQNDNDFSIVDDAYFLVTATDNDIYVDLSIDVDDCPLTWDCNLTCGSMALHCDLCEEEKKRLLSYLTKNSNDINEKLLKLLNK